jgi:BirA family biotin operon repressor/biotin-[acetyl-CoA-carboxylase] ligase
MSLVLKPPHSLNEPFQLTLLIAVALCRTVRKLTGANAGIKWPNDLLIDNRKVSGILVEAVPTKPGEEQAYIAGIGISVNLTESDYPAELRSKAISLRMAKGDPVDRHELICLLLKQVEALYELYLREGFSPVISVWEAHSVTLGQEITVQSAGGDRTGVAVRLDDSGALVLRQEDGSSHKLFSGDVRPKTG